MAAANSAWVSAKGASATKALALGVGVLLDRGSGAGKLLIELGEGDAGVLFLVGASQGHAQLQQIVRRPSALWIALVAIGEGRGSVHVSVARVKALTDEILCICGERVVRVRLDEGAQRGFGGGIVGLLDQSDGMVELLDHRTRRRRRLGTGGLRGWRRLPRRAGSGRGQG